MGREVSVLLGNVAPGSHGGPVCVFVCDMAQEEGTGQGTLMHFNALFKYKWLPNFGNSGPPQALRPPATLFIPNFRIFLLFRIFLFSAEKEKK